VLRQTPRPSLAERIKAISSLKIYWVFTSLLKKSSSVRNSSDE
jgi:hypothetical protein